MRSTKCKRSVVAFLGASLALQLASCGTILHPERRGQPGGGRLDPAIVALDAVGLILFFIPGVIAFAVDFSNGTIYLPPEYSAVDAERVRTVRLSPDELTPERLEQLVAEQTGRRIRLEPGAYRATRVESSTRLDADSLDRLRASAGEANVAFPRRDQ